MSSLAVKLKMMISAKPQHIQRTIVVWMMCLSLMVHTVSKFAGQFDQCSTLQCTGNTLASSMLHPLAVGKWVAPDTRLVCSIHVIHNYTRTSAQPNMSDLQT